ncbi:glycoside hydrolase family 2 TIM barrel [Xylanimonas cellulosilytica DSM 15894]|uniref:beta-mannosidase n=1 Tax=Xylanimonas cellulosilytica (strain DSM 15894 / JCM 12276 / CECT 5975 / KCTC 9989 / LMG 20990 / NBRC 107835 / XIL07) TaxID=446471 RepID=D1BUR6_XYLCX|nr:beta-mannosidase [Xylanimonas cellulosilytica]ACZ29307.1 glycoside hydrolase family 2 TIM barrel [Xylanimonas cellulosilytica DSM 15894]
MTFVPATFRPLHDGWSVTAVEGPVPDDAVGALAAGIPAVVPGEAHLDLLAAGLIADPFDGDNEAAQQWIGDTSWRFATTFEWAPDGETRHDLVAYGLDTVARVELNGVVVATTQNMHRSYRWDVRPLLRAGANTLTVTFAAPVPEAAARAERNGALPRVNHHEYNQLRKMACSFGWDWGIDVAGAGIWKPIGLDSWSGARIAAVRPLVDVDDDGVGLLTAHVEVERATGDEAVPVTVTLTPPSGGAALTATAVVPAGTTSTAVVVRVPDVAVWWPVGHGDQPLYGVDVVAGDASWAGRVGFRTVAVDTSDDAAGAGFVLRVNGEPVEVRGVNWIPDHAFLTKVTRERYARGIDDALGANVNLLRVWGGGIYEDDDLYDLADEAGILVWQDFLFACAAYAEDAETWAEVEAEARENVTRLSPHPSLVIWNGNNENTWGSVDWGWGGRLAGRAWGDGYYTRLLPGILAELDPTRFYSPASPFSFGPYRHPNDERFGTMHVWDVWNRADYTVYRDYRPRFVSEFGFQAPPAWSTLTAVVHDQPLDPFGPQMLVHQKANLGNKKLERGWQGHLPDPTSIEDWHWTTQLNQAHAIRFGIAHFRSLTPHCTGAVLWQLNDNWPVMSWAAVDHAGHRKPLWFALRDVFSPRLATLQPRASQHAIDTAWEGLAPDPDITALVLVNDTAEPFTGTFTATRQRFDGTVLATATLPAAVPARGAVDVVLPADVATFDDAACEVVVVTPDDADSGFATAFLDGADVVGQALDPDALTVDAHAVDGGVELRLTARSYVRDVFVHADKVDPAARTSAGLMSLPAGASATIVVDTASDAAPAAFAGTVRTANDLTGKG